MVHCTCITMYTYTVFHYISPYNISLCVTTTMTVRPKRSYCVTIVAICVASVTEYCTTTGRGTTISDRCNTHTVHVHVLYDSLSLCTSHTYMYMYILFEHYYLFYLETVIFMDFLQIMQLVCVHDSMIIAICS